MRVEFTPALDWQKEFVALHKTRISYAILLVKLSSISNCKTLSSANISIKQGLHSNALQTTQIYGQEKLLRPLNSQVNLQSEAVRGSFYFVTAGIALQSKTIGQSYLFAPISTLNVQQLKGSGLAQSFGYSKGFIEYVYLTSKSLDVSSSIISSKAHIVTLQSKVVVQSFDSLQVSELYLKKVLLSSEVICDSFSSINLVVTRPLQSTIYERSQNNAYTSIAHSFKSSIICTSISKASKTLSKKLSTQQITRIYSSSHRQTKVNLTAKSLLQSICEYADYKLLRPIQSNILIIGFFASQISVRKNLTSKIFEQSICEYADYKVSRKLSSNILDVGISKSAIIVGKLLTSSVICSGYSKSQSKALVNLVSKAVTQTISEYADYKLTHKLQSNIIIVSFSENVYSLKKNLFSKTTANGESSANTKFNRPFKSEVYSESKDSGAANFDRTLESSAISQSKGLVSTKLFVGLTSKTISQSISEYADYKILRPLQSLTFEIDFSRSTNNVTKKLTSQISCISKGAANYGLVRRFVSGITCSSFDNSFVKIYREYIGQVIEQSKLSASIYLTKKIAGYSLTVDQSHSNGSLQIHRSLESQSLEVSFGRVNAINQKLQFFSVSLDKSFSEYADYNLEQSLISTSIEASVSRATENYLGIDNIILDSLRKVNQNTQVDTSSIIRENE